MTAARLIPKRRNALFILIEGCIRELPAGDCSSFPTIATITAPRLRHIRHSNNNVDVEARTLAAVLLGQQKTGPPKRAGSCQAQFQSLETSLGAPPGVLKRRMHRRNRGQADSVPLGAQVLTLCMLRESLKFDACSQQTMRYEAGKAEPRFSAYIFLSAKLWSSGPFSPLPICMRLPDDNACQTKSFASSTAASICFPNAR